MVALESDDHAAIDREHETQRDVGADDQQQQAARGHLIGRELGDEVEVDGNHDHDQVGDRADARIDEREGAQDLVERARVPFRAVLRHEADERAAIAEIEHREIDGEGRRQHPQPVRRHAEMREVEGQHHDAENGVDDDTPDSGSRRCARPR